MKVIKRNGEKDDFCIEKIISAVGKAFDACNKKRPKDLGILLKSIFSNIEDKDGEIHIEDIQDKVEDLLMNRGHYDVAKAYILYRAERKKIREYVLGKQDFINKYKKSSNTANATIDDNSNVANKNIGILNSEIHKEDNIHVNRTMVTEKLKKLFPDFDYKQYVRDLEHHIIYKHDESSFAGAIAPYCCSISMYPFLQNGLRKIGGLSAAPKNLDSFCGMYVNLIFATSAMFAGACLYKDQYLLIKENGVSKRVKIKDIVDKYLINKHYFENYQGFWEYSKCNNLQILEDGKLVNINKVYRRKYNDIIYKITTKSGHTAFTSKDHIFKQLLQGRQLEIKASQLKVGDTVFMNKDFSYIIDKECKDFKKGWITGILCGDGCLSEKNVVSLSVNYNQDYLGTIFNKYSEEIYGYTLNRNNGNRCWKYTKMNKDFYNKIHEDIIGNTTYDKHIIIEDKSIDYIAGFLDGLFCADGSYSESHGISISLTNRLLSENINTAISYFGLNSNLKTIPAKENRKESYNQYISSKIIKYLLHSKKKILKKGCKNIYDVSREIYYYGRNAFCKKVNSNTRMLWSNSNQKEKYNTDIIESIKTFKNDDEYVYEIETSSHWYNCGGFITHNCATSELLVYFDLFARKEWGDDYYKEYHKEISKNCSRNKTILSQIHQYFQEIIYSINQPAAARGMQSAFTNISIFDREFFNSMFENFVFPDGNKPIWDSVNWLQKEFMEWFNNERLKTVLTFPVVSVALVYKDGKFLDEEMADFVARQYSKGNSFFTYISDTVDSLSSCCRLRNSLQTKEFNFTNGNIGIMTGSKSVITLNLNRIVQDWFENNRTAQLDCDECYDRTYVFEIKENVKWFKEYLNEILERVYKYHVAYNELLWDMYDSNLLPVYKAGFIHLDKQYLTIGLNGLNQAAEFFDIKCNNNDHYQFFCYLIFSTIKEFNAKHNGKFNGHQITLNTELVPAESLAIKNYNWDKEDGYIVPEDTNLYASYIFKPNDEHISFIDKLILHGADYVGEWLDGGSACHINFDSHPSYEQCKKILMLAAEKGCSYFTFNIPNSECEDCGYITKIPIKECPKCGSKNISLWDRVIGYLTKIKNWSEGRQIEQKTRVYEKH